MVTGGTDVGEPDEQRGRTRRLVGGHGLRARLAPTMAIVLVACGTPPGVDVHPTSASPSPTGLPTGGSSATTSAGPTQEEQAPTRLEHAVIVDLAADWRPEAELDDEGRAAQRRRIQAAENAIVRALGEHGRVRRQLHTSGQVALAVDDKGLSILRGLHEVAAIHMDRPDPPAQK